MTTTPFGPHISEAIQVADSCDPANFKHSEVRKLRRGLRSAVNQLETLNLIVEGRTMREEL